jgi:hypothetical protein
MTPMTPYEPLPTNNPEEFKRLVGLSTENFQHLNGKLSSYIAEQKARNPLTKRGRKDSKLILEDRLLLPLYYLRHYPTFITRRRFLVLANRIVTRYIHARQGCWPALKNWRTAKPCWKIQPPP